MRAAETLERDSATWNTEKIMNPPWQGVFFAGHIRLLQWSDDWPPESAYAFASQQVRHSPSQLQYHLCRIYFAFVQRKQESLYASLLDLFWALGKAGSNLKKRMLKGSQPLLAESQYQALASCLKNEISHRQLPFSPLSVLHDGVTGSLRLIEAEPVNAKRDEIDPVLAAGLCLEAGQTDQAREILEEVLWQEPDRLDVQKDLLEIYEATKDLEHFEMSYQRLQSKTNALLQDWETLADRFALA